MGKRHRMNGKMRRALADIKKMRRGTRRLIKKTQEWRGRDSEAEGRKMEVHFLQERKILSAVPVNTCSYMNKVLGTDKIWQRLDGKFVPSQWKSSQKYAEEFLNNFRDFFERKFGKIPVIVVLSPGDKWEEISDFVLEKVNKWEGNFKFRDWQVRYSKFFDYKYHPEFGPSIRERKRLFFRDLERRREKRIQKPKEIFPILP